MPIETKKQMKMRRTAGPPISVSLSNLLSFQKVRHWRYADFGMDGCDVCPDALA
jgi:hypothetical protein